MIIEIFYMSIMITGYIWSVMLIIEYLNVLTFRTRLYQLMKIQNRGGWH